MVAQYPHKITISVAAESTQDSKGNWVNEDPGTTDITCRAEPNTGNVLVESADGDMIKPDWMVYMPLPQSAISPGTPVEIFDQNNVSLGKGTIKRFSAGQLNARAWI